MENFRDDLIKEILKKIREKKLIPFSHSLNKVITEPELHTMSNNVLATLTFHNEEKLRSRLYKERSKLEHNIFKILSFNMYASYEESGEMNKNEQVCKKEKQ